MSDDLWERPKRFEIFVPTPQSRINLGSANLTETDEGPFGYRGISLKSGAGHLFVDVSDHTLLQGGGDCCEQVGGSWIQISDADMTVSTKAQLKIGAGKTIVIASGAGMGAVNVDDHGEDVAATKYNDLELHYQVDKIETSLFEFFHGRRAHTERGKLAKALGIDEAYFGDHVSLAKGLKLDVKEMAELATGSFEGGFLTNATKSLRELTPPGPKLTPAEAAAATAQARLAAATAIAQATPQGLWAAVAAAA
ncbi:MAG: hypothetical protein KC619_08860, partial [Myxococcales bacterium]|nr:hypothetical protein [Myxococcales bacterium]